MIPPSPRCVVASDLDGTLLDRDGAVSPRTREVVRTLRAAGGVVVAVTARPRRDAIGPARAAGVDLVVGAGGGTLADPVSGRVLERTAFDEGTVATVLATVRAWVPDALAGLDLRESCTLDPGFALARPGPHDTPAAAPVTAGPDVGKIIVRSHSHSVDALAERLRAALDRAPVSVAVPCEEFAEILPSGVDKATHLRRMFPAGPGRPPTVAFGDMPSDLPLLAWADTGVAVANAHPDLLAAADRVTGAHHEDGVAAVLQEIVHTMATGTP